MSSRLIYGFHAITAKLRHDPESVKEILVDASRQDARVPAICLQHAELQGVKSLPAMASGSTAWRRMPGIRA
jgi:23S rRNA (guanosine2251-2'-O)-methyltransferase